MSKQTRNPCVEIEKSIHSKLTMFCKDTDISVRKMINEVIEDFIDRKNLVNDFSKEIIFVGISSNRITLRNQKSSELTDVYYKEKLLYCDTDKTNYCEHTYFTLLLPEIRLLSR